MVDGAPRVGGGLGVGGHDRLPVAQLVPGQGGQVGEDVAEAVDALPAGSGLAGCLAWADAERLAGATGLARWSGCSSVKVSGAQALRRCRVR